MAFMYASGYWLPSHLGRQLAFLLMCFLQDYSKCAEITLNSGLNRFAMVPKVHFIHHAAWRLLSEAGRSPWCISPMGESVQMQEDFIGKPCRLSRRVSSRKVHLRCVQRCLVNAWAALEAAKTDDCGLQD